MGGTLVQPQLKGKEINQQQVILKDQTSVETPPSEVGIISDSYVNFVIKLKHVFESHTLLKEEYNQAI